jgi:ArsR family transcriptional regulator
MPEGSSTTTLLLTVSEPTRLRILNCLAAAPLFVSDLQAVLELPQPTISRHLKVLRSADVVRDTPIAQFVLYRLRRGTDARGRLLSAILDAVAHDEVMKGERHRAADRSRSHTRLRVEGDLETD